MAPVATIADDPAAPQYSGKLADPEFRRNRAIRAARSRTTVDAHIKAIVDAAPKLTAAQRDRLSLLLRPGSGGGHASA